MSTFHILRDGPQTVGTFAVGLDTGTLFCMTSRHQGIVLAGEGLYANREGSLVNPTGGKGIRYVPRGATIQIEV